MLEFLRLADSRLRHNHLDDAPSRYLWIVDQAKTLGFDLCGVVRAENSPNSSKCRVAGPRLRRRDAVISPIHAEAIPEGHAGNPERHRLLAQLQHGAALSTDPIVCQSITASRVGWISRYAWGERLPRCIGERLDTLVESLRERFQSHSRRALTWTPDQFRTCACKICRLRDGSGRTLCCSTK